MIVPGSGLVREQAEEEGIAQKLKEAGFEWRLAGCSHVLGYEPRSIKSRRKMRYQIGILKADKEEGKNSPYEPCYAASRRHHRSFN